MFAFRPHSEHRARVLFWVASPPGKASGNVLPSMERTLCPGQFVRGLIGAPEAREAMRKRESDTKARKSHSVSRSDSSRGGSRGLLLSFHPLDGEAHQTSPVLQLQLFFEVLAVGLHGLDAQMQVVGD